jgi:beta-lactamase superfamily II metal-dependent hydrolase
LTVHFIDVGQGDAILIDLQETEVLIDGGGKSPGVVSYLQDYVDGPLEVVVATHPHADHIGGLIAVLEAFGVDQIWHNGDTATSQTYSQFMEGTNSEGADVYIGRRGMQIEAGDLTLDVLGPPDDLWDDTNNNSIVLRMEYGDVAFVFSGDAEIEAEEDIVASGLNCQAEILKVGHHGSSTASCADYLDAIDPEFAIYMAGVDNTYGHPHEETVLAFQELNVPFYGTDVYGTILITCDGVIYEILTEK